MTTIRAILAGVLAIALVGCESSQEPEPSVPPPAAYESRPAMPAPVQLTPQPVAADSSPSAYSEDPVVMTFDKDPAPIPAPTPAEERPSAGTEYTIQRGDTLYSISMRFYGNRRMIEDIMKANPSIKDVNTIYVGQKITLP